MKQTNDHPAALVISWGLPKHGCEQAALQLLGRSLALCADLERSGRIRAYRPYGFTSGNYSHKQGLLILEGTVDSVFEVAWSKEIKTLVAQAGSLINDVARDFAIGGSAEAVAGPAAGYASMVGELDG
jgi:hypothetical protein